MFEISHVYAKTYFKNTNTTWSLLDGSTYDAKNNDQYGNMVCECVIIFINFVQNPAMYCRATFY